MRIIVSLDAKLTNSGGLSVLQSSPSVSLITSGHTGRSLSWFLEQLVFLYASQSLLFPYWTETIQ